MDKSVGYVFTLTHDTNIGAFCSVHLPFIPAFPHTLFNSNNNISNCIGDVYNATHSVHVRVEREIGNTRMEAPELSTC